MRNADEVLCFTSQCEEETENIGFNLADSGMIKAGDVIALYGDLGAGKTAFTRGVVRYFAPDARVTSPTFALVNEYDTGKGSKLYHFDMYRISTEEDLLSIDFYDFLPYNNSNNKSKDIIIIEWTENIEAFFDEYTVKIVIDKCKSSRKITFRFCGMF